MPNAEIPNDERMTKAQMMNELFVGHRLRPLLRSSFGIRASFGILDGLMKAEERSLLYDVISGSGY